MNTKTTMAFSIMGIVALVLLIAFAPIVGGHQALAFGWYGSPWGGYYGGWPGHYGGWGWHHGWGW
jgi:hypothetical protein